MSRGCRLSGPAYSDRELRRWSAPDRYGSLHLHPVVEPLSPALLAPTTTCGVIALTLFDELSGDRERGARKSFGNVEVLFKGRSCLRPPP